MITLFSSIVILIIGYFVYGTIIEKVFGPDDRMTPAYKINDSVDCMPMKTWKNYIIQLLNIAGTGPIFGALMGAVFGPVVYLWVVFGAIFAGAVHDYMIAMISNRHDGASIVELSGIYINKTVKFILSNFIVLLLLLVGAVFTSSAAILLANLTPNSLDKLFWLIIIFAYFSLATLLPISKVIGKFYPIIGLFLILITANLFISLVITEGSSLPELKLHSIHPDNLPAWPFMFVTVACGAISGFHGTQSPLISKCIKTEKEGKWVFYGSMITESLITLVWVTAGISFYDSPQLLNNALASLGQSGVVHEITKALLGRAGMVLATIAVLFCPITSGDTAFRSARLILAELFHLDQKVIKNRIILTLPLFAVGIIFALFNFDMLWRFFSWSNQTLAMITLWICTVYLQREKKNKYLSLFTAIPATFMVGVSCTYILCSPEGFKLSYIIAYTIGAVIALDSFVIYLVLTKRMIEKETGIKKIKKSWFSK